MDALLTANDWSEVIAGLYYVSSVPGFLGEIKPRLTKVLQIKPNYLGAFFACAALCGI